MRVKVRSVNTTLQEFGPKLVKFGKQILPEVGVTVMRRSMEVFFMHAVSISPFRTGRYSSSHRASLGSPRYARLTEAESYPRLGITQVRNVAAGMKLDSVGYVTNDAANRKAGGSWKRSVRRARARLRSYAPFLEAGSSQQAPQGVYGPALQETMRRGKMIIVGAMKAALAKVGM